jgi:hypothetical protein
MRFELGISLHQVWLAYGEKTMDRMEENINNYISNKGFISTI